MWQVQGFPSFCASVLLVVVCPYLLSCNFIAILLMPFISIIRYFTTDQVDTLITNNSLFHFCCHFTWNCLRECFNISAFVGSVNSMMANPVMPFYSSFFLWICLLIYLLLYGFVIGHHRWSASFFLCSYLIFSKSLCKYSKDSY